MKTCDDRGRWKYSESEKVGERGKEWKYAQLRTSQFWDI